jgi:hypothetical protein
MKLYTWRRKAFPMLYLPPVDDDGTDVFMAWPTLQQAKDGMEHQIMTYDLEIAEWELVELTASETV